MGKEPIPIWKKAALTVEEAAAYTGVRIELIRALAHAAKHGRNDFPAFWVGTSIKIARGPLLQWIADTAVSHKDLQHAAKIVENAEQLEMTRRRGRPRKRIIA